MEPNGSSNREVWTRAIPFARDRVQSHTLIWIVVPLLLVGSFSLWTFPLAQSHAVRPWLAGSAAISVGFAAAVWRLRAGTPAAAAVGGLICWRITFVTGLIRLDDAGGPSLLHTALVPLFLLFALTFLATRVGKRQRTRLATTEDRRGRSASQVIANLGFAGLACSWLALEVAGPQTLVPVLLAALCEATADTVSSELGQAFGGRPILLTTLRPCSPGTDGAISLLGTLAGGASAVLVAVSCVPAVRLRPSGYVIAAFSGIAGLFFDSLLGATLERRGWLGNDLVNFSSTVFAGLCALLLLQFFP